MRLITMSNDSGTEEYIIFTEDDDSPVEEFIRPGTTLDFEGDVDVDLPGSFPTGHMFKVVD